jgi:hypothetical protein
MTKAIQVVDFQQDSGTREARRLRDLPGRVLEGDPHHESTVFFNGAAGDFIAGTWTSTPGQWHAFTGRDEFCYIVSGHVRLIGDDGTTQSFKTGDAFLIPNGFSGRWEVVETTTKHFVIRQHETP